MSRDGKKLAIILGGAAFLMIAGGAMMIFAGGDAKLSNLMPAGATKTPEFRASFIEGSKNSCVKTATAAANGASAQQIDAYCSCVANGAADVLTEDDVKYIVDHLGSPPADLQQRIAPVAQQCLSTLHAKQ